jgi:hypothetical protein
MLKHLINYGCLGLVVAFGVKAINIPSVKMPVGMEQPNTAADKNVDILISAIIKQESGRQYNLVNPHSGALGFAQVMPENVGPWCREAGLGNVTQQEFLNSPSIQKKVIRFKIGQYYKEALKLANGDTQIAARMVASAWYSGQYKKYNDTRKQFYPDSLGVLHEYPSIDTYTMLALKSAKAMGFK